MMKLVVASTFWNKRTTNNASSARQTPLAAMCCFQRLQHRLRGGSTYALYSPNAMQLSAMCEKEITSDKFTHSVVAEYRTKNSAQKMNGI